MRSLVATLILVVLVALPAALIPAATAGPSATPRAVPEEDPLPLAAGPPESLADAIDPLPILVRDLPDDASRAALAAYDGATVLGWTSLDQMLGLAWSAVAGDAADPDLEALRQQLIVQPVPAPSEEFSAAAQAAISKLSTDPRSIDRLNNLAIALWLVGARADLDPEDSWRASGTAQYAQLAAMRLLEELDRAAPGHRALLLNLAFLRSVVPYGQFDGAAYALRALDLDQGDVTARLLLASLQARRADAADGAARATGTLAALLDDPETRALGLTAVGDAHLASASIRRSEAPGAARHDARLAIEAYDEALATVADPGVYAGRANALAMLDALGAAIESQERALELAPQALELQLGLARLHEAAGDVEALAGSARIAVEHAVGGWNPEMLGVRFVTAGPAFVVLGDAGFLGWSTGSDRDRLPVRLSPQGGGYVVIDVVPRTDAPGLDHDLRTEPAPIAALHLALEAAVAGGDADTANALVVEAANLPFPSSLDEAWVDAATLVAQAGGASPSATDPQAAARAVHVAQTTLRRLGRFDAAAILCRSVYERATDPAIADPARRCAAESAFHASDPSSAVGDLGPLVEPEAADASMAPGAPSPLPTRVDPALRLVAGAAAEAAGDPARADRLFRLAAADASTPADASPGHTRLLASLRLGDLALARGDALGALENYELALATIEANDLVRMGDYWNDSTSLIGVRAAQQVARNNRGIALLRSLQPAADSVPDCSDDPRRARCEAALSDFRFAAGSDPGNAVYRLNEGWASRLLGDAVGARNALALAVELDPTLYPAFNDLGVLLARSGDVEGATRAFEHAVHIAPDYELAHWNLGIVGLQTAPGGIVDAQESLARAIRLDPSLRTAPLEYRLDERTYRFGFEAAVAVPSTEPLGRTYGIGAVVLASAATAGAIAQLQGLVGGQILGTASGTLRGWTNRQLVSAAWRRGRRRLRTRVPRLARPWLPWLATLVVLLAITVWQTVGGAPEAELASVLMTAYAIATGLVAHAAGHLVAARILGGRLVPSQWTTGVLVSLVMLPFQAATGPFLAERFRGRDDGGGAWRFHIAGPLANALVAVVAYALFVVEPIPLLRLIAVVQLTIIGYTLLPVAPLDGHALSRSRPQLLALLGIILAVAAGAFALGVL